MEKPTTPPNLQTTKPVSTTGTPTTTSAKPAGGCGPFCLAIALIMLITAVVIGGSLVLIVRQVVPTDAVNNFVAALTGQNFPITNKATLVLERIQALSQLTTFRYEYSVLVTSERDMPDVLKALYGEKEMLAVAGNVNAGIDLSQITPADISQSGDTLTIHLPPTRLQECFLDEKASYVVSRETGIFAHNPPTMDESARQFAVEQIRDQALSKDILTDAQTRAQMLIQGFTTDLNIQGVKTVTITTSPPDPNTLPDSCK